MRVLRFLAAVGIALALAGAAQAKTTISFYSHGWGVASLFVYFPHAFVVIRRDQPDPAGSAPPPAPRDPAAGPGAVPASYGFTAVSQGPEALTGPTPGVVESADPDYMKRSTLHLTVEITDQEYEALLKRIAAWSGPGAPPYDLNRHNCVGFVADLASAIDLKTPTTIGRDPTRYLDQLARLNPDRNLDAAPAPEAAAVH